MKNNGDIAVDLYFNGEDILMSETFYTKDFQETASFMFSKDNQKAIYDALVLCFSQPKCRNNQIGAPTIRLRSGCENAGINPILGIGISYNSRLVDMNTPYTSNYTKIQFQTINYQNYNNGSFKEISELYL